MDLSDITRDAAAIEAGQWVDEIPGMGDLRLKVRGRDNADWRRLESSLLASVPRSSRIKGRIAPDDTDRITAILLRDTALIGWENLTEKGAAVPYSKDAAARYLNEPQYRAFRDAVLWAATVVAEGLASAAEDTEKN